MKISLPPGVFDIIPEDLKEPWKSSYLWTYVENHIRRIAFDFGFHEIRTPLFERTELFCRSVGDTSDIVSKEMYTFEDRGGRSLSLRPEGTAPAMRAFIEHQMHQISPLQKMFYIAPMFRYERSQAGRYRQHHQFGAEAIGSDSPLQDAEMIDFLHTLYLALGLKNLTLNLNSIGSPENRKDFRMALVNFLTPLSDRLSSDSQQRLKTNPLRILDSKDVNDRALIEHAPSILDFLGPDEKKHFDSVCDFLKLLGISYRINPLLVRGLDYYNKTVFEIVAGELGAQNSLGGGGRFDGLLADLEGPNLPCIGFGTGIERILQTMIEQEVSLPQKEHPLLYLVPMGEEATRVSFKLLHELRTHHISAQMDFTGKKVSKALQYANELQAVYVAVIGEDELKSQEVELKEMKTASKRKVSLTALTQKETYIRST